MPKDLDTIDASQAKDSGPPGLSVGDKPDGGALTESEMEIALYRGKAGHAATTKQRPRNKDLTDHRVSRHRTAAAFEYAQGHYGRWAVHNMAALVYQTGTMEPIREAGRDIQDYLKEQLNTFGPGLGTLAAILYEALVQHDVARLPKDITNPNAKPAGIIKTYTGKQAGKLIDKMDDAHKKGFQDVQKHYDSKLADSISKWHEKNPRMSGLMKKVEASVVGDVMGRVINKYGRVKDGTIIVDFKGERYDISKMEDYGNLINASMAGRYKVEVRQKDSKTQNAAKGDDGASVGPGPGGNGPGGNGNGPGGNGYSPGGGGGGGYGGGYGSYGSSGSGTVLGSSDGGIPRIDHDTGNLITEDQRAPTQSKEKRDTIADMLKEAGMTAIELALILFGIKEDRKQGQSVEATTDADGNTTFTIKAPDETGAIKDYATAEDYIATLSDKENEALTQRHNDVFECHFRQKTVETLFEEAGIDVHDFLRIAGYEQQQERDAIITALKPIDEDTDMDTLRARSNALGGLADMPAITAHYVEAKAAYAALGEDHTVFQSQLLIGMDGSSGLYAEYGEDAVNRVLDGKLSDLQHDAAGTSAEQLKSVEIIGAIHASCEAYCLENNIDLPYGQNMEATQARTRADEDSSAATQGKKKSDGDAEANQEKALDMEAFPAGIDVPDGQMAGGGSEQDQKIMSDVILADIIGDKARLLDALKQKIQALKAGGGDKAVQEFFEKEGIEGVEGAEITGEAGKEVITLKTRHSFEYMEHQFAQHGTNIEIDLAREKKPANNDGSSNAQAEEIELTEGSGVEAHAEAREILIQDHTGKTIRTLEVLDYLSDTEKAQAQAEILEKIREGKAVDVIAALEEMNSELKGAIKNIRLKDGKLEMELDDEAIAKKKNGDASGGSQDNKQEVGELEEVGVKDIAQKTVVLITTQVNDLAGTLRRLDAQRDAEVRNAEKGNGKTPAKLPGGMNIDIGNLGATLNGAAQEAKNSGEKPVKPGRDAKEPDERNRSSRTRE